MKDIIHTKFKKKLHNILTMNFILLLIIVPVVIYIILNYFAKPLLIEEKLTLIEKSGNKIISDLGQKISMTRTLTASLSNVAETLKHDENLYKKVFPKIMNLRGYESIIAGGGVWPEPYMFSPDKKRRSFFWGREKSGNLKYYDDYNDPKGAGYHNEEWYVPAKYLPAGKEFWSKSYMDPYSYQPMVTCTIPYRRGKKLLGVSTIDLKLEGLREFIENAVKNFGGYGFAVDRNNKFLSFPNENLTVKKTFDKNGKESREFIYSSDLAKNFPQFKPINDSLNKINKEILNKAEKNKTYEKTLHIKIDMESYQISKKEARLISAVMLDPLKDRTQSSNKLQSFSLTNDIILREPVIVSIFHMPKTYWKIIIVTPYQDAIASVNNITKEVLTYLVSTLILLLFLFFILFQVKLSIPLRKMMNQLKKIKESDVDLSITLNIPSDNELGELAYWFNRRTNQLNFTKQFLNNIIDSMPSILISIDENGIITQCNQSIAKHLNIKPSEALGKKLSDVSKYYSKYEKYFEEIVKSRQPIELHREKYEGQEVRYNNITLFPLVQNGINGMVIKIDDITEIEKKDAQNKQSQKMELVGTLAGGLAHDFNNVLGGIIGTLSILKYKLSSKSEINKEQLLEYLQTIEDAGNRAQDMVQQLLALSRKQEFSFSPVDLNQSIKNVIKICKNTFDKSIQLHPNYLNEESLVNADATQLEQVFLNLFVNASHAMTTMREIDEKKGGHLYISIEKILADKFFCNTHPQAQKIEYWNVSTRDTGVGMNSNTVSKIFDPFYTTKEKGKGTGLGLSMVYNIVKKHNGFIDVYSEAGIGTTFNVFLPSLDKKEYDKTQKNDEIKILKGEGTILIIDDEAVMRELSSSILKECGYSVILAKNGKEGVEKYKKHMEEISGVLLDMVMPVKSGDEAFKEIKDVNKNVKVLLASGFRKDKRVEKILNHGANMFIQKPYTLEKLSKAVFDLLKA